MAQIAYAALSQFMLDSSSRILLKGADIQLPARAAQPLCLTLHELATNATKYGALSGLEGRVDLAWHVLDQKTISLHWQESGGPPVTEPTQLGEGMQLIDGLICYELSGQFDLEYDPQGLICHMSIPLGRTDAPINPQRLASGT